MSSHTIWGNALLASVSTTEAILHARTRDELLLAVCKGAVAMAQLELAWVALLDPDTRQSRVLAHAGPAEHLLAAICATTAQDATAALRSLASEAEPEPRLAPGAPLPEARVRPWLDAARTHGLHAYLALPLVCAGVPLGVLHLHAASPGALDGDPGLLLSSLARSASTALEHLDPGLAQQHTLRVAHLLQGDKPSLSSSPSSAGELAAERPGHGRIERDFTELASLLHSIMNSTPDLIYVKDVERRMILCNQGIASMLGKRPEELYGRTDIENGFPAELAHAYEQSDRLVLAGGQVRIRDSFWLGNQLRHFDNHKVPLHNASGIMIGVLGIARDITELVLTEQALAESEASLRRAQEVSQVGSWHIDMRTSSLTWSEQSYRIFGVPLGKPVTVDDYLACIHPEDRAMMAAYLQELPSNPYSVDYRVVIDGRVEWVQGRGELLRDATGKPVSLLGTVQNITERKRAIEEITRTNRLLEALGRAQSRFIAGADRQSTLGEMLSTLLELTGSEHGFLGEVQPTGQGGSHIEVCAVAQRGEIPHAPLPGAAWAGLEPYELLIASVLASGETVIVNGLATLGRRAGTQSRDPLLRPFLGIPFKQGETVLGIVGLVDRAGGYDAALVSSLAPFLATGASLIAAYGNERRRQEAEQALRLLNAELEQRVAARTAELEHANRELEAFTYSVSHDLKSPLRGIDGYSNLLLTDHAHQLDDEGRHFLHRVRAATQHMGQLIDDLLAYSRLERRTLMAEIIEPRTMIDVLLAERSREISDRGMVVQVAVPELSVPADREGLAMALRNLLENAFKFTRDARPARIELGGQQTDAALVLWVRDNGCGFDMSHYNRIFEVFQRLHRAEDYPGTGVGLALVRKAMQRMGGRVWAESQPGQGATFYLELPYLRETAHGQVSD